MTYVKTTWVDGSPPATSGANLNNIESGVFNAHYKPYAAAFVAADITIATATLTGVQFDTESADTDNMHSVITNKNRITFNTPGAYQTTASICFAQQAGGVRELYLRALGSNFFAEVNNGGAATVSTYPVRLCASGLYVASAGDYIEAVAYQDSGSSVRVLANNCFFSAAHVSF